MEIKKAKRLNAIINYLVLYNNKPACLPRNDVNFHILDPQHNTWDKASFWELDNAQEYAKRWLAIVLADTSFFPWPLVPNTVYRHIPERSHVFTMEIRQIDMQCVRKDYIL